MTPSQVSIIICTRNRVGDTLACVRSIRQQSAPPGEIVIIDSGEPSDVATEAAAAAAPIPVRHVASAPGLPLQRMAGVRESKGELLLFLDDDVELEPNHLEALLAALGESGANTGGVQGTYIERQRPGVVTTLLRHLFLLPTQDQWSDGRLRRSGASAHILTPARLTRVETLRGGDMLFRRAVFERFAFDTRLEGYGYMEDIDFTYRVSRAWPLYHTPAARLVHHGSPASRQSQERLFRQMVRNASYLHGKNLPQDISRRLALAWSVAGYSVLALLRAVRARDGALARAIPAFPGIMAEGRAAGLELRRRQPDECASF